MTYNQQFPNPRPTYLSYPNPPSPNPNDLKIKRRKQAITFVGLGTFFTIVAGIIAALQFSGIAKISCIWSNCSSTSNVSVIYPTAVPPTNTLTPDQAILGIWKGLDKEERCMLLEISSASSGSFTGRGTVGNSSSCPAQPVTTLLLGDTGPLTGTFDGSALIANSQEHFASSASQMQNDPNNGLFCKYSIEMTYINGTLQGRITESIYFKNNGVNQDPPGVSYYEGTLTHV